MRTRKIPLPPAGVYYVGGYKPRFLDVGDVPDQVTDEELTAYVAKLCADPRGLYVGRGDGAGDIFYKPWKILVIRGRERGLLAPSVPVPVRRGPVHVVQGVGVCDEHGVPVQPAATA